MDSKTVYLTFDMDWASDKVLSDFYQLIKSYDLVGTLHVTHSTEFLETFRNDGALELGIHPNYNMCLSSGGDKLPRIYCIILNH